LAFDVRVTATISWMGVRTTAGNSAACAGRYAVPTAASIQTSATTSPNGPPSATTSAAEPATRARESAVAVSTRSRRRPALSLDVNSPASAAAANRKPTGPTASGPTALYAAIAAAVPKTHSPVVTAANPPTMRRTSARSRRSNVSTISPPMSAIRLLDGRMECLGSSPSRATARIAHRRAGRGAHGPTRTRLPRWRSKSVAAAGATIAAPRSSQWWHGTGPASGADRVHRDRTSDGPS
jgi:hypothetical protein